MEDVSHNLKLVANSAMQIEVICVDHTGTAINMSRNTSGQSVTKYSAKYKRQLHSSQRSQWYRPQWLDFRACQLLIRDVTQDIGEIKKDRMSKRSEAVDKITSGLESQFKNTNQSRAMGEGRHNCPGVSRC